MSEVVSKQEKLFTVHQHHLAVIARKIVGSASHGDPFFQKTHFQFAEVFLAAAIGERNLGVDKDTALGRVLQGMFKFCLVKAEDNDLNALLCPLDGLDERREAVRRLNDQLQMCSLLSPEMSVFLEQPAQCPFCL